MNKTTSEETLLPQVEVKTLRGARIIIEPWGLKRANLMLARLETLFRKARDMPDAGIAALVEVAYDEFYSIVRDTIEWDDERMERELTLEDLIALAEAIWSTSVAREDGSGLGGKLAALIAGMGRMTVQVQVPETKSG
jgi:hypothetical protein